jgi:hypothetical protein
MPEVRVFKVTIGGNYDYDETVRILGAETEEWEVVSDEELTELRVMWHRVALDPYPERGQYLLVERMPPAEVRKRLKTIREIVEAERVRKAKEEAEKVKRREARLKTAKQKKLDQLRKLQKELGLQQE